MNKTKKAIQLYKKYVMPTYSRSDVLFSRGAGVKVWDIEGNQYLDFFPGWAVSGIGHCHKGVVSAIRKQAGRMIHVSNNYYNELQAKLAQKIIKHSFPGNVFFSNSGAEANEGAIKLARKYGHPTGRYEIITMQSSFHGRTIATLTATGQDKVKVGFEPLPKGFKTVPFNDLEAVKRAVTKKTVGIMLEPIQGEGGVNIADQAYMKGLRRLCNEKDMLLILDEVQTGMGRTGEMFCFKHYGIVPDVMTLAKSLGGGVPVGCVVAGQKVISVLSPGSHASTFGGSPLICAASIATFEAIEKEHLLVNTRKMGRYLKTKLEAMKRRLPVIKRIKGMGLMIGIELSIDGTSVPDACLKHRLLINCTQKNTLRIMPPLIVTKRDIDKALTILEESIREIA